MPAPSRPLPTKFYLFRFRPSPTAHPPEPQGEARPRCPPPPPALGTAELPRQRPPRWSCGGDPALAAVAPGQGGRGGAAGERRQQRLPLSSVSGWTAVSVAMSAARLEPE